MTEAEWLSGQKLAPLLTFLEESGRADARKLRLFAAACCRALPEHLLDEQDRAAVELAERAADGAATDEDLADQRARLARRHAATGQIYAVSRALAALLAVDAARAARDAAHCAAVYHYNAAYNRRLRLEDAGATTTARTPGPRAAEVAWGRHARREVQRLQVRVLRDLVGNPFRPVEIAQAWRTPPVLAVARSISDERHFHHLPVLGDALEEAGCTDDSVLSHCRRPGPHARGCWLLDALAGGRVRARLAA